MESSVQTFQELNERLRDIEDIVQGQEEHQRKSWRPRSQAASKSSYIDVVVISHEFTDHCNKRTLLELDRETTIFATRRAVRLIQSWKYFLDVHEIPSLPKYHFDWRKTSQHSLPDWLGICQVTSQYDTLDYHSAILLAFDLSLKHLPGQLYKGLPAEAIVYTPHGIHAQDLDLISSASPQFTTLALMHGLHDITISVQRLNLGAHNGLRAQRKCQAKYWVSTHDEVKKSAGFITPWLHRKALTLKEALDEEREAKGEIKDESALADVREVIFADLLSGESLLLV